MKSDHSNTPNLPTSSTDEQANVLDSTQSPEAIRRSFLKRFGGYAVAVPVITFTLMSSHSSKAIASGQSSSSSS